jgi:hypothetical protein
MTSFSAKYINDNQEVLCGACYSKYIIAKKEAEKRIMKRYILRSLEETQIERSSFILKLYKNPELRILIKDHSLDQLYNYYEQKIRSIKANNMYIRDLYTLETVIEAIREQKKYLNYIITLNNLYKIFRRKGIDTNFHKLIKLSIEIIEKKAPNIWLSNIASIVKKMKKRLGRYINTDRILTEYLIMHWDWNSPWDIEHAHKISSSVLENFGIEYDQVKIKHQIRQKILSLSI